MTTYWRYKLAQRCVRCGAPPVDGVGYCELHRLDEIRRQQKRRGTLVTTPPDLDRAPQV